MNIYRIYPTLWNDGMCQLAQTVYAVDRCPEPQTFKTICSARPKEDPSYYWDSSTFQRLIPPGEQPTYAAVTWKQLPAWLSYVQTLGYSLQTDLSTLKPHKDIYISGP